MYNTYNSRQVNSSPLFLLLFSLTLVLSVSEDEIVREIEEQISKLMETTTITRSVSSKRGLEGIMLRMAGMGFIALSRNEIFAETQSIFQPDDLEEIFPESGTGESRSQYVPTVGLGEKLFTVPSSYLMQVRIFSVAQFCLLLSQSIVRSMSNKIINDCCISYILIRFLVELS